MTLGKKGLENVFRKQKKKKKADAGSHVFDLSMDCFCYLSYIKDVCKCFGFD